MIKRICAEGDCPEEVEYRGLCREHLAAAKAAGKFPKHTKARQLRTRYGIKPADYLKLLAKQGGVCAICKRPPQSGRNLVMDHDYRTRLIRGLLHRRCNLLLTRALQGYLENPPGAEFQMYVPERVEIRRAQAEALKEARKRNRAGSPRRNSRRSRRPSSGTQPDIRA